MLWLPLSCEGPPEVLEYCSGDRVCKNITVKIYWGPVNELECCVLGDRMSETDRNVVAQCGKRKCFTCSGALGATCNVDRSFARFVSIQR